MNPDCPHDQVRELIAGREEMHVCRECGAPMAVPLDSKGFTMVTEDHSACTLCEGLLQTREWDGLVGDEVIEVCSRMPVAAQIMWRTFG